MKRFSFSLLFFLFMPFVWAEPKEDTPTPLTQAPTESIQAQASNEFEKTNPKPSSPVSSAISENSSAPVSASTEPLQPQAPSNESNTPDSFHSLNPSAAPPAATQPALDSLEKQSEESEEESEESLGDIMDLRPAVPLKMAWDLPLILLILLFLLFFLWMILRWKKKTKTKAKTKILPLDPYVEVSRALQESRQKLQVSDPKPFVFLMDEAVRLYLSRIFPLPAPESTTQELLDHLTICTQIPTDLQTTITNFLQQCDLVKFTQLSFEESFLLSLHQQAQSMVQTAHALTQPKPIDTNLSSNERKSS